MTVGLAVELGRLAAVLRAAVGRLRGRSAPQGMGGLAVFEGEVDAMLERALWAEASAAAVPLADEPTGRFAMLAGRFGLGRRDLDVVALALAPEIHPGYGRVIAYLHDDLARTRPTVGLALDLFAPTWEERLALRARLLPGAPLWRHDILAPTAGRGPGTDDPLVLEPGILRALLGADLGEGLVALPASQGLDDVFADDGVRASLRDAASRPGALICLRAPSGSGKRTLAAAVGQSAGATVFLLDASSGDADPAAVRRWLREVGLAGGWPCVDAGHAGDDRIAALGAVLAQRLAAGEVPVALLLGTASAPLGLDVDGVSVVDIELAVPRAALRESAWRRFLDEENADAADDDIESVASVFPLPVGRIQRATGAAIALARRAGDRVRLGHLQAACRAESRHRLDRLADRVATVHGWSDIVLGGDALAQLGELAGAMRARRRVLDSWRFGDKVAVNPGVSALFFGPPGTGKTMAAGIVAADLGMELYRVDLSRVVSKYIGETEKNLEALFDEASRAWAVLFFDEADAMFGKRGEARDAQDRWANLEISYLLQRMECHDGIAILATNLRKNLDPAFLRRIQFAVEFTNPGPAERLDIWRKALPVHAEIAADVDLEFLARAFDWPGGNIRNIALRAAYLAAAQGCAISMRHLIAATRRELQKQGRLVVDDEFREYGHLLRGAVA